MPSRIAMREMNNMKERSIVRMAPWGPQPITPHEAGIMEVDMADVEVAAAGMIYISEIRCGECSSYYHCDLLNNYVMAYVLFSCVLRYNDVMWYVKLLYVTYVLSLILFLITFCFCFLL